jgi:hypothetical protein
VHTIQAPKEYRFLKITVADDYKNYIQIRPSDHNIEVAPEFFDFENINVVTIRDGFKGEYNLQINVTKNFPDNLRGKPIEIKLEVLPEYFDHFPGTKTDLTKKDFHKYTVKVPSLYIAVPFKDGEFKDKVLYTSAQASDLDLSLLIGLDWKIDGIKYVTPDVLDEMANATVNTDSATELDKYWERLGNKTIKYKEEKVDYNNKKLSLVGIKDDYPYFPQIVKGGPDKAEVTVLIRSSVAQIPYGQSYPIDNVKMKYNKWNGKPKESEGSRPFIYGSGAWIVLNYGRTLFQELPDGTYVEKESQDLYHDDEGIMRVDFTIKNIGNGDSYNTVYEILLDKDLTYISHAQGIKEVNVKNQKDGTNVTFELNSSILKGHSFGSYIYLRYYKCIESYGELTTDEYSKLPKSLKVAKEAAAIIDLTQVKGENRVTERIRTPLTFDYQFKKGSLPYMDLILTGRRKNPEIEIKPNIDLQGKDNKENVQIRISRTDYTKYSDKTIKNEVDYELHNGKIKSIKVKPNNIETSNKDHNILYRIKLKRSDNSYILSEQFYNQKDIGLSTAEIVLIVLSSAFFAAAVLFLVLAYRNMKLIKKGDYIEKEITTGNIDRLLE